MGDIFLLTLRQLTTRRRFGVILLLAAIPVVAALAFAIGAPAISSQRLAGLLVAQLIAALILPLVTLLMAAVVFGEEVEERTLAYLVLKPISRWAIVLPKVAAAVGVSAVIVAFSGATTVLVVTADARAAMAAAFGVAVGAATYAAIFTWAGLVTRHALAFGLVYVFLWEAALSNVFGGMRLLSVREYTLAVIQGLDRGLLMDSSTITLGLPSALVAAAVATSIAVWLTEQQLRTMDVP